MRSLVIGIIIDSIAINTLFHDRQRPCSYATLTQTKCRKSSQIWIKWYSPFWHLSGALYATMCQYRSTPPSLICLKVNYFFLRMASLSFASLLFISSFNTGLKNPCFAKKTLNAGLNRKCSGVQGPARPRRSFDKRSCSTRGHHHWVRTFFANFSAISQVKIRVTKTHIKRHCRLLPCKVSPEETYQKAQVWQTELQHARTPPPILFANFSAISTGQHLCSIQFACVCSKGCIKSLTLISDARPPPTPSPQIFRRFFCHLFPASYCWTTSRVNTICMCACKCKVEPGP